MRYGHACIAHMCLSLCLHLAFLPLLISWYVHERWNGSTFILIGSISICKHQSQDKNRSVFQYICSFFSPVPFGMSLCWSEHETRFFDFNQRSAGKITSWVVMPFRHCALSLISFKIFECSDDDRYIWYSFCRSGLHLFWISIFRKLVVGHNGFDGTFNGLNSFPNATAATIYK